jgi:hypothetical protein
MESESGAHALAPIDRHLTARKSRTHQRPPIESYKGLSRPGVAGDPRGERAERGACEVQDQGNRIEGAGHRAAPER